MRESMVYLVFTSAFRRLHRKELFECRALLDLIVCGNLLSR
jgi:hypothetical protein